MTIICWALLYILHVLQALDSHLTASSPEVVADDAVLLDSGDSVVASAQGFNLKQNYPNPFNPETTIAYEISEPAVVLIRIFDLKGQEIDTLKNERQDAGSYAVVWRGTDGEGRKVASGVYFCSHEATVEKGNLKYYDRKKRW